MLKHMEIPGLIKSVKVNVKARDHESVLKEMFTGLLAEGGPKTFRDLEVHESSEGALAGTGGAIFHCFAEEAENTVIALGTTKKAVSRKGGKGAARVFFVIVSPMRESGTHMQLLSRLEALLLDRAFTHAVLAASTPEEARRAVKWAEGSSKALYLPLEKDEVLSELGTSDKGLSHEEAASRLGQTGPNTIKGVRGRRLHKDLAKNLFFNLFAALLWAGGLMSFIAGMPELASAIFLVIVINAVFSFIQEYKAERAVEALTKLLPLRVKAIRGGKEVEVEAAGLVPGDLVKLSEGGQIPADGRLISSDDLKVDNSALTGESRPVWKTAGPIEAGREFNWIELPNMAFAGTGVASGAGTLVVTATGMDTEIGSLASLTQAIKNEESPLQKEISRLTKTVTLIAVVLGALFFLLGWRFGGLTLAGSFIFAIGIIVANVPEGLLPTVSLSLAMGVQRMASRRAIVKKLSSVETLGSASVICTDKTGTLTENRMSVTEVYTGGRTFSVKGDGYAPEGSFFFEGRDLGGDDFTATGIREMLEITALCNNARLNAPGSTSGEWTVSGDPTEGALLSAAARAGVDLDRLIEANPRAGHIPFERIRKRMTTIHGNGMRLAGGLKRVALTKGAPKEVLSRCDFIRVDGKTVPLTEDARSSILSKNDSMAASGLRVLAAAFGPADDEGPYEAERVEKGLTFSGLAAMRDPLRPEVKRAVEECASAGIKIIMMTGDYGITARTIASEAGIAAGRTVTGEELSRMSGRELKKALKGEVLFARVAPQDKLRVVAALQENGETVAVTGDGVNDAPALKKADIGIAMGRRGSDVAKGSADMILTDDNFASIVEAVREGRAVYSNIRKFVTYIFASNVPEMVPFIAFVLLKIPLPLTIMQILAVDLGTDVLPALGLGAEPPEPGIMKEPPRPRGKRLLDFRTLSRAYLFLGLIEAALAMSAFFFLYWMRGWTPGEPMADTGAVYMAATTMTFAAIVAAQIGNVMACRTSKEPVFKAGLLKNRLILAGIALEAALVIVLTYTPLRSVFNLHPLRPVEWAFLLSFPFIVLLAEEARKAFGRRA
ncbi:sodium/potassium-transporting ATPase subunit alpha,E; H+/K+-exchanging ATPase [uncultured bacterium]|nr:sodium/potassium-transporting ATPase subunit alpha,E; H+/K+-exchanging ATPase [uncultured bacterium]